MMTMWARASTAILTMMARAGVKEEEEEEEEEEEDEAAKMLAVWV